MDVAAAGPDHIALSARHAPPDGGRSRYHLGAGLRRVRKPHAGALARDVDALDRPLQRTFRNLTGTSTIFEITIPALEDSARFTFIDTRTTAAEGRVRVSDANWQSPFSGPPARRCSPRPPCRPRIALAGSPTPWSRTASIRCRDGRGLGRLRERGRRGERFTLAGSSSRRRGSTPSPMTTSRRREISSSRIRPAPCAGTCAWEPRRAPAARP